MSAADIPAFYQVFIGPNLGSFHFKSPAITSVSLTDIEYLAYCGQRSKKSS